jgi:hypothetical protein
MTASRPDLGYYYHPQDHEGSPGSPCLEILLSVHPTGVHYDPERVRFTIAPPHGGIDYLTVHAPWRASADHYRVCAGRVLMEDRHGKDEEAFSFGGDLTIRTEEDRVRCVLISPAPIIDLCYGEAPDPACLLAEEVEGLLARRRAAWGRDPDEYEARLAACDPFALYTACVAAIDRHIDHYDLNLVDSLLPELVHLLHEEMRALKSLGTWPDRVPALEDLL